MPPPLESARPTLLNDLSSLSLGRKVRVAGRLSSYDPKTCTFILLDKTSSILVDASLCVNPFASHWVRIDRGILEVIGRIEAQEDSDSEPEDAPTESNSNSSRVLKAILVLPRPDLQLDLWESSLTAMPNEVIDTEHI
ncbi:hypothetical protein DL96DRAFT_1603537 [Flagelloscypha sp. PMI_526]|nr:hypothetical protein DL96DRAFT_1603537 [Flagelloscypha sp. PMI_526]